MQPRRHQLIQKCNRQQKLYLDGEPERERERKRIVRWKFQNKTIK